MSPTVHRAHGDVRRVTPAMEDYLRAVYRLRGDGEAPRIATQRLAAELGISGPSVTNMVKRLDELGLVRHTPYHGVALTAAGELIALEVVRHHRLLERYLSEVLGFPLDAVHAEADRLEHHISEELEARMEAALGHPTRGPPPCEKLRCTIGESAISVPWSCRVWARSDVACPDGQQRGARTAMTHRGCSRRWGRFGAAALPLTMALAVAFGVSSTAAQDATPEAAAAEGRPAHIHSGSCAEGELGDVVQPLTNLMEPEGDREGQDAAVVAETSFTTVPLALDDILGDDYAINIHLSTEEIGTYIACGEIGGPIAENGSLTVGLRQQSDSGFTGIAVLTPNADDEETTDVSASIAPVLDAAGGGAQEDEATPTADVAGEAVDVTLTEWELDMPDTLSAGPTTFTLINDGEFPHTIEIEGEGVEEEADVVEPGDEGTFELDLEPGTYTFYCPVGDGRHREQGMEIEVTVE